jgi:spore germination protein
MRLRVVGSVVVPVLTILSLCLPATHGTAPAASSHRTSSVWLPYWNMTTAFQRVTQNSDLFDLASPLWYDAATCSTVKGRTGAGSRTVIRGLVAEGLRVIPSVTGSGLGPRAAIRCFSDARRRAAHVKQLVRIVTSRAYRGIDIDYENLALTTDPVVAKKVQRAFSVFVEALCRRMRSLRKVCVVTVMPRTSDELTVWRGKLIPGVYDYTAIAASASRMRVMAYDQHAPGTAPGPIAGFPWVRKIAAYTARKAPLGKVELGVPTYGRDWSSGTAGTLTGQQAIHLARVHGVTPVFDRVQRELTFRYRAKGVRHRVWFSNPRAVAARYQLARNRGMVGAAYWAAGLEQRGTWRAVRNR